MAREAATALRRGWTTGARAAAAARAAFTAMLAGRFPDPVSIRLPRGGAASFPLALAERDEARARAGVIKDAGDDPDVTNGALIIAETERAPAGAGIRFAAGEGVGAVTRNGLSLAAGHLDLHSTRSRIDNNTLAQMLAELGAGAVVADAARSAAGAGEILALAGDKRAELARRVAAQAREVALATLSGKTTVEVAIVDRQGDFLARVGA